jgi:hypothetical protein
MTLKRSDRNGAQEETTSGSGTPCRVVPKIVVRLDCGVYGCIRATACIYVSLDECVQVSGVRCPAPTVK